MKFSLLFLIISIGLVVSIQNILAEDVSEEDGLIVVLTLPDSTLEKAPGTLSILTTSNAYELWALSENSAGFKLIGSHQGFRILEGIMPNNTTQKIVWHILEGNPFAKSYSLLFNFLLHNPQYVPSFSLPLALTSELSTVRQIPIQVYYLFQRSEIVLSSDVWATLSHLKSLRSDESVAATISALWDVNGVGLGSSPDSLTLDSPSAVDAPTAFTLTSHSYSNLSTALLSSIYITHSAESDARMSTAAHSVHSWTPSPTVQPFLSQLQDVQLWSSLSDDDKLALLEKFVAALTRSPPRGLRQLASSCADRQSPHPSSLSHFDTNPISLRVFCTLFYPSPQYPDHIRNFVLDFFSR